MRNTKESGWASQQHELTEEDKATLAALNEAESLGVQLKNEGKTNEEITQELIQLLGETAPNLRVLSDGGELHIDFGEHFPPQLLRALQPHKLKPLIPKPYPTPAL